MEEGGKRKGEMSELEQRLEIIETAMISCCGGGPLCDACGDRKDAADAIRTAIDTIEQQKSDIESLEAKIDALMLEFCPEDMTKEQMDNWEKHQIPSG